MARLRVLVEADEAMTELWASNPAMCDRIEDIIDEIMEDPSDPRHMRRSKFLRPPSRYAYIVHDPAGGEDWCFLWRINTTDAGPELAIYYVGPNVFE